VADAGLWQLRAARGNHFPAARSGFVPCEARPPGDLVPTDVDLLTPDDCGEVLTLVHLTKRLG
jgi:hypothetical protein